MDWRAQSKSFEGMAIVHGVGIALSDSSGFPENLSGNENSADVFRLVGQRPMLGRDFTAADETPGAAPVAILSYGFWERRYGKDPAIIGRTVRMNGAPDDRIGVMPQGFSFPQKVDVWVPLVQTPSVLKRENRDTWMVVGRLADGVTIESARAEMDIIGKRLATAYPLTNQELSSRRTDLHASSSSARTRALIYGSMWGAVGFVLLIACANLANLLLARAIGRSREISVRIALGAGRWRIIRQLLIESVMLSGLGGFLGWWIAKWGVRSYELAMASKSSWLIVDYTMDQRVLGYLIAISIGTGLLFGLAPALPALETRRQRRVEGWRPRRHRRRTRKASIRAPRDRRNGAGRRAAGGRGRDDPQLSEDPHRGHGRQYGQYPRRLRGSACRRSIRAPRTRFPSTTVSRRVWKRCRAWNPSPRPIRLRRGARRQFPYELAGAPPAEDSAAATLSALKISPAYFRTLGAAVLSGREFNDADVAFGSSGGDREPTVREQVSGREKIRSANVFGSSMETRRSRG